MDVEVTQVGPGVHHARARHVSWTLVTDGVAVTLADTGYPGTGGGCFGAWSCWEGARRTWTRWC
jgi:hypothetical protein